MATSRRVQVGSAIGAIVLLGGAWLVTVNGEDGDTARTEPTVPERTTTSAEPAESTTTAATSTTTPRPTNTEWGALNLTDVTEAAGLDEPQAPDQPVGPDGQTGGVAVADYDEDGDQDILLTRVGLPNRLMANDGTGTFTDVAEAAGVAGTDQENGYAAPVWADVDGDGHLDLFLTGAGRGRALLLVNDGDGRFTDQTAAAGLDGLAGEGIAGTASYGAALDDWDHDGDLDLIALHWYKAPFELQVLTNPPTGSEDPLAFEPCNLAAARRAGLALEGLPGSGSKLFENDGTGRFTDVTADSGVDLDQIVGFQPVFDDVDGDGWDDLFITGDYCTSRLYRNDQGEGFTDITDEAGVGTDQNGMGSVVADLTGDGNLDWFVSAIAASLPGTCASGDPCSRAGNRLYAGDGTGNFTEATDQYGVRNGSWGWGAVGSDLNHDGRLDLLLANGVRFRSPDESSDPTMQAGDDSDDDPTNLWVNTGDGPWPEAAERVGITDRANGKGVVAFDADADGDLDIVIANTEVAPLLYRNDTPTGSDKHWLQLRLRAPGTANPYAVGAVVTVDLGDGTPPRRLKVRAGGSFQSSDPTDLHVGLGPIGSVPRIEIRWPGRAQPQVLADVAADQLLEVTQPS